METQWLAFSVAALVVTMVPGPDTFLVLGNSLTGHVRRGFAAVAGILSGGLFHMALFGVGAAQLLAYSERAFFVVKLAGAAYLVYLGVGALRSALWPRADAGAVTAAEVAPASPLRRSYVQGLLTNALNPKVAVFYLAFLPQFLAPGDHLVRDSLLMIAIHYAMAAVWLGMVALGVSRMARVLRDVRVVRTLEGLVGAMMLGFGVRLALTAR